MSTPAEPIYDVEGELVVPLIAATAVPVESVTIVQVSAPATLSAGYSFQAVYDNTIFTVVVPDGGVLEGQIMHVPFRPVMQPMMLVAAPAVDEGSPLLSLPSHVDGLTPLSPPPFGRWNDYLFDCCAYGCCHPSFFNAIFFPRILMAQVMTRMKLNICAIPVDERSARRTCPHMVILILFMFIFHMTMNCDQHHLKFNDSGISIDTHSYCPRWQRKLQWVVPTAFGLYTVIVLAKLRRAVRKKYRIPVNRNSCGCSFCCCCCGCLEDICCALWCSFCTIAQLARQTGDYDKNHAACCTRDGFRRHQHTSAIPVPAIVV